MKVIDLSHLIFEDMMVYPGTEKPNIEPRYNIEEDGFRETKISMFSHVGTHIDSPAHMIEDGKFLNEFQASKFIGTAMVLNFSDQGIKGIELEEIKAYENKIRSVDFVILNTGWHKYWGRSKYFEKYPVLSEESASWLSKLNLKGIGVDAISVDAMDSKDFYAHNTFLQSEFIIIENLTNLGDIEEEIFTLSVLPLKYNGADGSPVRAVAIY